MVMLMRHLPIAPARPLVVSTDAEAALHDKAMRAAEPQPAGHGHCTLAMQQNQGRLTGGRALDGANDGRRGNIAQGVHGDDLHGLRCWAVGDGHRPHAHRICTIKLLLKLL